MSKSHKRTIGAAACMFAAAGLTYAGTSVYVAFESGATPTGPDDCDAPDYCVPFDWTEILIPGDCTYINGELEKRVAPHCEPDTYLVCFNKQNVIIDSDDNSSELGNGWASGLWGSDCFVDNGDGTRSLRLGVTGRPDGLDGVFNGLFQNGPHGQLGCFIVYVDFRNAQGGTVGEVLSYEDEFQTGAEAFHINYTIPAEATEVHVNIDNQCGSVEVRCDVDFFKLTNLVPLCDYCIEQIAGLNCECRPTDARLGWYDKSCTQILTEGEGGAVAGYAKMCAVADVNGEINVAVSGEADSDFDGLDDAQQDAWYDAQNRAPVECPEPKPGHGEAGCYTLKVYVTVPHTNTDGGGGSSGDTAVMQQALDHGDLNMDGVTNTADLGVLLGNFGWVAGN
ncbi:MAG: hypothetical protein H6813_03155 [Phycisphaeraceae bacterium]|nr:hypothetical protein [Phycisphaeraceae bacterium]MCB9846943.1 hypothetical protein [Phycisphaeraceae bacterium]